MNSNVNPTYNWVDITEYFLNAVKDLSLGELLHDGTFGLFEAMSAIEMMDPKMDAGMLCNRGTRKIKSFDQAVKENKLKLSKFTISEQIGIIDTTLSCVVSWLEGHSLAQTVFTNLYLHKPYLIQDRTLKAFCLAVFKLLEIIKDFVHKAMVYEEEDFQPVQYGYHLSPDISEQRTIGMLREVEEELHKKSRNKNDEKSTEENEELSAIFARIKFMRVFYQSLLMLLQRKEDIQPPIIDCQRLFQTAIDMLLVMRKTVKLGVMPTCENSQILGFEPLINQRLLPPTFPRYTKIKARNEAMNYFERMIDRLKIVCKIQHVSSFHQALDFFIDFSKGSPCILSRSALQLLYLGSNTTIIGSNSNVLKDLLKESAKAFISPPALMSKTILTNQQARLYVDTFLTHCTRPFANLLQLCGHNRARQRDKLAHLLEEFTALQDEAERVDAFLHNLSLNSTYARPHLACFGTWILYHTLRIMIMYLVAGFELELYSVHEYYYIYWYLYEFLYGWLVSALTRADSFLVEQELVGEMQKTKGNKKSRTKFRKKVRPYHKDIIFFQALQNMCGGYYKALIGFRMEGKLKMPDPQFDNERVRYEHRFAPFQNLLTPPPVPYSEFRDMTTPSRFNQQSVDSIFLYIAGCKHFHQARQLLETIQPCDEEVTALLKICKTNFVVLKLLSGGHKKESINPPNFDFTSHQHFPLIKWL
ncbi:N-alpha-acetyltransferase 35, NatC auxiliary subunit isoform X2 [Agrilus planipennis]|uniref:Protein MAK10 homolog n=1 Tax=Agrilus planipennis TaxID=224129 RepID=A0A1W4XIT6_AGRPL|nr:N-alpha-acetyltransferase 35, NatC auxiliary subunit isoform X2 [Agrilus planipennis]